MRGIRRPLTSKDGRLIPEATFSEFEQVAWRKGTFTITLKPAARFDANELAQYEAGGYPADVEYLDEAYAPLARFVMRKAAARWTR